MSNCCEHCPDWNRQPTPPPPAWRSDSFIDKKEVCHFIGSLTREQAAAAKVVHNPQEGLHFPFTVFYPED